MMGKGIKVIGLSLAIGLLLFATTGCVQKSVVPEETVAEADEPILGPTELAYLRSALRAIKMTPQDLLYNKNTDPFLPYRLKVVDRLMANPIEVPFYTDQLSRDISNPKNTIQSLVTLLSQRLDLDTSKIELTPKSKIYASLDKDPVNALKEAKNLPEGLTEALAILINNMSQSGFLVKEAFANVSPEGRKMLEEHGESFSAYRGYENLQRDKLIAAGVYTAQAVDSALLKLRAVKPVAGVSPKEFGLDDTKVKGNIVFYAKTEAGELIVGGSGANEYIGDFSLIIDLGGNDIYTGRAGGTDGRTQPPVAICIDLGRGNNEFIARLKPESGKREGGDMLPPGHDPIDFCQGGALAGVGILVVDGDGDNNFVAGDWSQGAAHFGVGVLVRNGKGNASYKGLSCVQGAASFGIGLLVNSSEQDKYAATFGSQGFGGPAGLGLLLDKSGNDKYYAGGRLDNYPTRPKGSYIAMSQGFGFGLRPGCSGGVGIIIDNKGDDFYHLDNQFGMGGSYWYGFGMLVDDAGNDTYQTGKAGDYDGYTMGAAIHLAAACLIDRSGNDKYHGNKIGPAIGWDLSPAWLIDGGGTDEFTSTYDKWNRMAGGTQNGCGFLIKKSGSARFEGYSCPCAYTERDTGSIGIIINLGKGEYKTLLPGLKSNQWWTGRSFDDMFSWCAGIDGPVPPDFKSSETVKDWPTREHKYELPKQTQNVQPEEEQFVPGLMYAELFKSVQTLVQEGRTPEAISKLKEALAQDAADPDLNYELSALLAPGNIPEAIAALTAAVKNGYADIKRLEADERMLPLKNQSEYKPLEAEVRGHALTTEEMQQLWIECLKERSANWDKVSTAQERFKSLGRPGLYFAITNLLSGSEASWGWAADVVTHHAKAGVPVLLHCLKLKNDPLRGSVIYVLGRIGDQRASADLMLLLDTPRFTISVCRVLGGLRDAKAVPAILKLTSTEDFSKYEGYRKYVAVSLGQIADVQAVPQLIKMLDDPYYSVRYPAERALINIGKPAEAALIKVVKENKFPSAAHAIEALGRIKSSDDSYNAIISATKNQDWAMRGFAAEALGEFGRKDAVELLNTLRKQETHPFVLTKIEGAVNLLSNPPKTEK